MATEKIDQLFKRATYNYEATPSAEAWTKLSGELQEKRTIAPYYAIAAAVTLLIVAGLWIVKGSNMVSAGEGLVAEYPLQNTEVAYNWSVPYHPVTQDNEEPSVRRSVDQKVSSVSAKREVVPVIELPGIVEARLAVEVPTQKISKLGLPTSEAPAVSIRYIATASEDAQEKGNFRKILSYATSNTPIEIFSDIRDAKNNFISKTLD